MKLILLAAAAVIATPTFAQQSGSTGTSSPTTSGAQSAVPPTQTTPGSGGDMGAPAPAPQSSDQMQMPSAPTAATGGDPVGGYQPSAPAMSGPMQPGATVTFQAAPSPDQAYPAPAPLAKYPVCKAGQFDKCIQASDARGSRAKRRR